MQGISNAKSIFAGDSYSIILENDGTLWTCANSSGQLGDSSLLNYSMPREVLSAVRSVAGGDDFMLILKNDKTVWACGNNSSGQLGIGSTASDSIPQQVALSLPSNSIFIPMNDVQSIAAGFSHSLMLKSDGTAWACGENSMGELGNGTTDSDSLPAQVLVAPGNPLTGVRDIAAGYLFSLFLKTDGTLWVCGDNSFGQLGDGTTNNHLFAVQIMSNVQAVRAGDFHTLILKTDGTLWACGNNRVGQLGFGALSDINHTPMQIKF
jgi:alpha-tubulin suppressor-like RCC1 family protein